MGIAPNNLLRRVCWSFAEPVPASPEALVEAARQYAADINYPDPSDLLSSILPVADLRLHYTYAADVNGTGEWEDKESELRVLAPEGTLTGAFLLWKLHMACHATAGKEDHHYFEGLVLVDEGTGGEPPLYEISLGS